MKINSYTITTDSVAVIVDGEAYTVRRGAPNFIPLCRALLDGDYDTAGRNLTVRQSLEDWAKGDFSVRGERISYKGEDLPAALNQRITAMVTKGESPQAFFKFWERVQRNPSYRSVQQLWDFLTHCGIPLTEDGCFLAYKSVRPDLKDYHSKTFDNSPGAVNEMERNRVSDDPSTPCHEGFHVGALEYAQSFRTDGRIVICKVDPQHVVSVPSDYSCQKMRVCRYEVIGFYATQLSSTVHEEEPDDYESDEDELLGEEESPEEKVVAVKVPKRFAKLQAMPSDKLLEVSIDKLRQYATYGLKIVGASKIPGGKISLISRILDVREAIAGK